MTVRTQAQDNLARFMSDNGLINVQVARALKVSKGIITAWLSGASRPVDWMRRAIERWTHGQVRASDWLSEGERSDIAAIIPFQRSNWVVEGAAVPAAGDTSEAGEAAPSRGAA